MAVVTEGAGSVLRVYYIINDADVDKDIMRLEQKAIIDDQEHTC